MTIVSARIDLPITCNEDAQVQHLLASCDFEEVIGIYHRLKPDLGRILNAIGVLYAKKGDYKSAITYHTMALQIQEKNSDDISDALTELGFAYQNLRDFDMALIYHLRALSLRQLPGNTNPKRVAINLLGIANAYWGQENLSDALIHAQQALTLNQSIKSGNDQNIAANLAILANIYHSSGNDIRALQLAKQALILIENCEPPDSSSLFPLLNNIGIIQVSAGLLDDALLTFMRLLYICDRTLPQGHSRRLIIESNIKRVADMQNDNVMQSFSRLCNNLTKFFML